MRRLSQDGQSQHERIKKNIRTGKDYFSKNCIRFHKFRKYVYETSLTDAMRQSLEDQGKPTSEFNILDPYVSRLLGEFAKHEPSIEVRRVTDFKQDPQIASILEGHLRHINYEANKNSYSYEVYKDLLTGGFSVIKVFSDYESEMSMDQIIKKERVFDPTLCGFDPLARHSHKGDGKYSFELYPKLLEDFKEEYPGIDTDKLAFRRDIEGFNWSYLNNQQTEILLLAEYFEKKYKKTKIIKLANNAVMTAKNYEKLEQFWQDEQILDQIPKPVGKSRMSDILSIDRYLMIESEIIEKTSTDYSALPHIFVTGSSINLQDSTNSSTYEFTKPYIYHAQGIQDLKNFAGQCLGDYLENLVQHKFIVMKEALPQEQDYLEALTDHKHASTIIVQAYSENNPDKPIPNPIREVINPPAPTEIMATFGQADQSSQMILGTFDAALGINDNQLSGVAVIESATQSNACAFPYLVGYLQAETQAANITVDLIGKRMKGRTSIPVISKERVKSEQSLNGENDPKFDFPEKSFSVEVSAGVNYSIAKNRALQQIFAMMQASPKAAEFFATDGFPQILDNMEFHGSDIVKEKAEQWLEKQANAPKQPSPEEMKMQIEMEKLKQKREEAQDKKEIHQQQMQVELTEIQADISKIMANLQISKDESSRANKHMAFEHAHAVSKHHMEKEDMAHRHKHDEHNSIRESAMAHRELSQPMEATSEAV